MYKEMLTFTPDGSAYKGDTTTPLFALGREPFDGRELMAILTRTYPDETLCTAPPVHVAHNAAFLLSLPRFSNFNDIKCDEMGIWKHTGSPKRNFCVIRDREGTIKKIKLCDTGVSGTHELKRIYFTNSSDKDVKKILSTVTGMFHISYYISYLICLSNMR